MLHLQMSKGLQDQTDKRRDVVEREVYIVAADCILEKLGGVRELTA